jgi:hypothetical protein
MATIDVKDAGGATVAIEKPLVPGRAAAAASRPVALSTEDKAALDQLHADLTSGTPAGSNLIGRAVADASPATGGIGSTGRILASTGSNSDKASIRNSTCRLYAIQGYNNATVVRYLKLYDTATTPTPGAGTPVKTLALPPKSAFAFDWPVGYSFSSGLGITITTDVADTDVTSVAADDILALNLDYLA